MSRRTGARRGAGPLLEPRRPHPLGRRLPGRPHPGSSPAPRSNFIHSALLPQSPGPRSPSAWLAAARRLGLFSSSGRFPHGASSSLGPRGRPSLRVARRNSARLGIESRLARRRSRPGGQRANHPGLRPSGGLWPVLAEPVNTPTAPRCQKPRPPQLVDSSPLVAAVSGLIVHFLRPRKCSLTARRAQAW